MQTFSIILWFFILTPLRWHIHTFTKLKQNQNVYRNFSVSLSVSQNVKLVSKREDSVGEYPYVELAMGSVVSRNLGLPAALSWLAQSRTGHLSSVSPGLSSQHWEFNQRVLKIPSLYFSLCRTLNSIEFLGLILV